MSCGLSNYHNIHLRTSTHISKNSINPYSIGVGATQHTLSNGVTAIAKWGEGNIGEFIIQRFTGATVANSSEDGGGLEFSKNPDSFDISVFRSDDATNKFI